jgi:hypothetical protein
VGQHGWTVQPGATIPSPTHQWPWDRGFAHAIVATRPLADGRRSPTGGPCHHLLRLCGYKATTKATEALSSFPFSTTTPCSHHHYSPPVTHQLRPPFYDSSRVAHRRDLTVLLPPILQLGLRSSGLPDGSRSHWPPATSEHPLPSSSLSVDLSPVYLTSTTSPCSSEASQRSPCRPQATSSLSLPPSPATRSHSPVRTPTPTSPSSFQCRGT